MNNAIELHGLAKRYGPVEALRGLDLVVPSGQIVALLGPNGAGKSTATEVILGLVTPDSGTACVFARPPRAAVRQGLVGAMLQNGTLLPNSSVAAMLRIVHGLHERPLPLGEVIERAGIRDLLRLRTDKLSGGQAQRVRFALAILPDPRLLLLDEPTVGLDVDARRQFWSAMTDLTGDGRTVVFATHYLDEADEFATRIVVLDHGRLIADGTGADIKARVGGRQVTFAGPDGDYGRLPGVVGARKEGSRHLLSCSDSDAALRALVADPAIHGVEVSAPSLEEAFLELVA